MFFMQVGFAILGFISGSVGLRGTFAPEGDNQDTVKVHLCLHSDNYSNEGFDPDLAKFLPTC